MIILAVAALMFQAEPVDKTVIASKFDDTSTPASIPEAIREPVARYSDCRSSTMNKQLAAANAAGAAVSTGAQLRALIAKVNAECADQRAAASREAYALLAREHMPADQRAKLIEQTFASLEKSDDDAAARLDQMYAAYQAEAGTTHAQH